MPPGSARGSYRYANAGFIVAGAMLEEVADESWESLMQRLLFEPLGMPSAGFGAPGSPGTRDQPWGHRSVSGGWEALSPTANADNPLAVGPAGTVHASLPDLAAYYRMHLEGDVGRGVLLTPASFERLHRPAPGTSYACGWVVTERDWARGRALWHNGSNTYWFAVVWLAPNRDLGVFAATNVGGDTGTQAADDAVGLLISRFGAAFP
jgi:CubicO group peptidase (beta-lactamase class C family)